MQWMMLVSMLFYLVLYLQLVGCISDNFENKHIPFSDKQIYIIQIEKYCQSRWAKNVLFSVIRKKELWRDTHKHKKSL